MAKFRLDKIASLAHEMTYAPANKRVAQLAAAESLLLELEGGKAYPDDYVVFRITGYRPKRAGADLLTGLALQHDLGLLVELVSDSLAARTADFAEPVLQIDDLTARFNVTSKTIQRWRRRGLPARRFTFPDGRRRVGFVLSLVERFLARNGESAANGTNATQVSPAERDEIVRRARRLATDGRLCEDEITRRIAGRLGRSPLTILHTLRRHDAENPTAAVLSKAAAALSDEDRARIVKFARRGRTICRIAHRIDRPRALVYRVLMEDRLARVVRRKVRFIDDPLYHEDDADRLIDEIARAETLGAPGSREEARVPRDLPPYLQDLYRTPLLSPAGERALFIKFNFHKYQFAAARRRIEPMFARWREVAQLEELHAAIVDAKNAIVRANLRLVVSVARKHLRPGLNLMELVSDGNITLMRAVESFDVHRGFRFSTYASLSLMKGFARSVPLLRASAAGPAKSNASVSAGDAHDRQLAELADSRGDPMAQQLLARDEVLRLLSRLSDREREIVQGHFGVDQKTPASYDELGARLGLTKARVRQIEHSALRKLRDASDRN